MYCSYHRRRSSAGRPLAPQAGFPHQLWRDLSEGHCVHASDLVKVKRSSSRFGKHLVRWSSLVLLLTQLEGTTGHMHAATETFTVSAPIRRQECCYRSQCSNSYCTITGSEGDLLSGKPRNGSLCEGPSSRCCSSAMTLCPKLPAHHFPQCTADVGSSHFCHCAAPKWTAKRTRQRDLASEAMRQDTGEQRDKGVLQRWVHAIPCFYLGNSSRSGPVR